MKRISLLSFATLLATTSFWSCSKSSSDEDIVVYKVPVSMAARYMAMAFSNATAGLNYHFENAAGIAAVYPGSLDTSFTVKNTDTTAPATFQYLVEYHYSVSKNINSTGTFTLSSAGFFNSSYMHSNDQQHASLQITNLDQAKLTFNGSGQDGGSENAQGGTIPFSSTINFTLNNLIMDKTTHLADAGSAAVSINGLGPGGVDFGYSGTLTFLGNRKATLLLGGSTFNVDLATGGFIP